MSSVYLFLSLTYKNIDEIWQFAYGRKFKPHRFAFCRVASITLDDLIEESDQLIDRYIDQFEERIPPLNTILFRLAKLRRMDKSKHEFIEEWNDIDQTVRQYKELVKKLGIRRTKRYLMANRINYLMKQCNMNERIKGFIINKVDGRDDPQLMKKINELYNTIKLEFGH